MPLTPDGYARAKVCEACSNACHRPGQQWYACDRADGRPINAEILNNPDNDCPDGKWDGLEPLDVPARGQLAREEYLVKETAKAVAYLKAFGATIPETDENIRTELARLQDDGILSDDVAARVEVQLIADREATSAAL